MQAESELKRKEEALEALKTELDSAQQERHAKVCRNSYSNYDRSKKLVQSLHLNISSLIRRQIYMRSFRHPRVLALSHEQDITSLTVHSSILLCLLLY